jgi:hypothetical protein
VFCPVAATFVKAFWFESPDVEADIVIVSFTGSELIVTLEPATKETVSVELSATILLPPAAIVLKASEAPPPLAVIVILLFELSVVIDIPEPATKLSACDKLLDVTLS